MLTVRAISLEAFSLEPLALCLELVSVFDANTPPLMK